MPKANDTDIFKYDLSISLMDYLFGTDATDGKKNKSYRIKDIIQLVNSVNGINNLQFIYSDGTNPDISHYNTGVFLTDTQDGDPLNFTQLIFNKSSLQPIDLTLLFNRLAELQDVVIKLDNPENPNNFFNFKIVSITDETDYFVFEVVLFKDFYFGELLNETIYSIYFDIKSATDSDPLKLDKSTYTGNAADLDERIDALESQTPGDYVKIVYVNSLSPNTATIFSEVTPPVVDNPSLREDTDNLYIGTDLGNWLWNPTTLIYGTKLIPNASNFKLIPSGIDAGSNKTSDITREGSITTEKFLSSGLGHFVNRNGSNTPQIGGFFAFSNAIGSGGNMFQLNASNGIDLWNYASSAWTKRFTFSSSGTITATAASLSNEVVVKSQLDLKVDKDGTKVLSDVNFSTALSNKLASIDATHYLAPLQTTVQLSALPQASISDKARVYVENDLSDYFYDATASSGDIAPDDQTGGIGFWRKVAVGGETAASIKTKYESNADTNAFTNALKAKLDSITEIFTTALKSSYDGVVSGYTALIATGSRLITTGEITKLTNTSGTNSGDNATNTQYSGLATSKQDTLVSGTNIKTLDGDSLLGSGNLLPKTELAYALADETANLTVSTRIKFRMPFAMTLSDVRISLNNAPTISSVIVDVKENGVSIFSTLLSIDANEKTSVTAATPAVISDINLADDAEITVSTTQIGSGDTGKGLKILFKGRKA